MKQKSQKSKVESLKLKAKSSKLKTFIHFLKRNYFLLIFVGCIGFVGVVAFYKLFISKPTYIYAKIKVGQGYWWATTQRPSLWFLKAIEKAKEQKDLAGKPLVKMISIFSYPYWGGGQYEIFVTVQLKVSKVGSTGTYNFNRETIGVSAPIDLEFPNVQFSGTVIDISEKPFKDQYEYKTVTLYRKLINPWEYEEIHVGDTLRNGKDIIFEVLSKERGEANDLVLSDFGKMINPDVEPYRYATIKIRVRLKKVENVYFFGEEMMIAPGRGFPIVINDFAYNDFTVTKVE